MIMNKLPITLWWNTHYHFFPHWFHTLLWSLFIYTCSVIDQQIHFWVKRKTMGGGVLGNKSIFFRFHKLIESLLKTYMKIRRWKDLKIVFVFRIFNELIDSSWQNLYCISTTALQTCTSQNLFKCLYIRRHILRHMVM